jgi:hypothetical protein
MSQDASKTKRKRANTKAARNQKILIDAANGATNADIVEKYGLSRQHVTRILNSDEMKAIVKRGESQIHAMVDKALKVIERALDSVDEKLAAEIAVRITKSVGALKDKVDVSHSYPKPTVIVKPDGTRVVMGVSDEEEEEND